MADGDISALFSIPAAAIPFVPVVESDQGRLADSTEGDANQGVTGDMAEDVIGEVER